MSDNSDLENRTIDAIRNYREALAVVENLEREQGSSHRALTSTLLELGRAIRDGEALSLKDSLFEIGSAACSRSDEASAALSEATARLESARLTLAALERQLGYIPDVSIAARDSV